MENHKNASLTHRGREAMARSVMGAARRKRLRRGAFHTTPKTVAK